MICYPGHSGGDEEAAAVVGWAEGLGGEADVARYGMLGTKSPAPFLTQLGHFANRISDNRVFLRF